MRGFQRYVAWNPELILKKIKKFNFQRDGITIRKQTATVKELFKLLRLKQQTECDA